jgi:hypothetical protein
MGLDNSPPTRFCALGRQELEQCAYGGQQPAPGGKNGVDDAGARSPVRQDVDELPGYDLLPHHHLGSATTPTPATAASHRAPMSSLTKRGT